MIHFYQLNAFTDNFIYILRDEDKNITAAVDPGDPKVTDEFLISKNWNLDYILNTHDHWDHVDGNEKLKSKYDCQIFCSEKDKSRIPGNPIGLNESTPFPFEDVQIIDTPGHTSGHISYYFKNEKALFCGDTLFSMGCGRIFDGTLKDLYNSLQTIKDLPDDTQVFCTHEYTLSNIEFALSLSPKNIEILEYQRKSLGLCDEGLATIPCELKIEKLLNPFLTTQSLEEFSKYRLAKDNF